MKRLAWILALVGFASPVFAAGGPENAVVVVNADSWASTWVANEYVQARGIPASHVIHLADLTSFERMPVEEFRQQILMPVLRAIDERGLAEQIDYVLYSTDFPTAIDVSSDIGQQRLPQILTKVAAINGLTFLHQAVLAKDIGYLDLGANRYARAIGASSHDTPWNDEQRRQYAQALSELQTFAQRQVAMRREAAKSAQQDKDAAGDAVSPANEVPRDEPAVAPDLRGIVEKLAALRVKHPHSADVLYNLACALAWTDRPDDAMEALQVAVQAGWWNHARALRDHDLRALHERTDFQELIARMKAAKFEVQPPVAFDAATGWQADGGAAAPNDGQRYLLSTMLAYTSGRGNSVRESLASLRRSIAADGSRPAGTIYFLENGDIRSTTRAWGLRRAAEELQELGVQAAVEPGVLPRAKSDVAGATIGAAGFDWAGSGSTILPGAICEHLTSCGGMLHEGDGQTPLTEFIRHGAAGASGTVTEPYALQAKFPTPFIHWFYAQGTSLAEAFYLSVTGPYQLLIVGDGLCQPWARQVALDVDGLPAGGLLRGTVALTPRLKTSDSSQLGPYELYVDGRRTLTGVTDGTLRWDTCQTPDGPHELSLVAEAAGMPGMRAAARLPVVVSNAADEFRVTTATPTEVRWDQPLELEASLPGAKEIAFRQHAREIARITGERGRVQIDPRCLGQGPSRIQPVGMLQTGGTVWGQPLDVQVLAPPQLPALEPPAGKSLAPGFHVRAGEGPPQVVGSAQGDWLAKAGVLKNSPFAVEAWFEAPDDDMYQFQIRGDVRTLSVDGVAQDWPRGKSWWFVPVPLARGLHRLHLEGVADAHGALELRFGGRGAQRLDGKRFRHVE